MKLKVRKSATPSGIVVLQDTRETLPIVFSTEEGIVGSKRQKLDFGDYQALYPDGSRSSVVFERKSVPDLWITMTKGHNRFMREVERAKEKKTRLVLIIEAPFSRILVGFERSRYSGTAMVKKLWTLHHSYDLPFVFCQSRQDMSSYMAWSFIAEKLHRERLERG